MTDETENALAIAELRGRLDAQRAENEAMESRIDARLASLQADLAKRDKDNQRWTITLVLGCTALVIGAVALFS
ncbi:MAG: hypothetical protein OXE84_07520 [Rhodobacteraceae bacterium]|nr:hypothetical protein [Paracoccaceae bacterium]MCY4197354.1 hypothetical protein [Paracoccaceae bacterium]